ncbi:MAG: globin domain-containing protein [Neomegalonema sp.]|nr:globin domain-containing protein [Neomegalonema sp.]
MSLLSKLFGSKPAAPAKPEGPLSAAQIKMMQDDFAKVAPIADTAAEIFYTRLFEIAPQVKPMFGGDVGSEAMKGQGAKLMATLGAVVNGLDNLDAIVPVAQQLAVKHVDYGVKPEHYAPVGEALIYTLDKGLGDGFTAPHKEAWLAAYGVLSGVMIEAAYGKAA